MRPEYARHLLATDQPETTMPKQTDIIISAPVGRQTNANLAAWLEQKAQAASRSEADGDYATARGHITAVIIALREQRRRGIDTREQLATAHEHARRIGALCERHSPESAPSPTPGPVPT